MISEAAQSHDMHNTGPWKSATVWALLFVIPLARVKDMLEGVLSARQQHSLPRVSTFSLAKSTEVNVSKATCFRGS